MRVNPYLNLSGRCHEAFAFYAKALDAKILMMMTFADSPMAAHAPPDWQHKIMHASLKIGDTVLMGSDGRADMPEKPQGFSVSLIVETAAEAERVFQALSDNATVSMPVQETFWAVRFGMLTDQFGISWMVNCERKT